MIDSKVGEAIFEIADAVVNPNGYAEGDESDRRAEKRDRLTRDLTAVVQGARGVKIPTILTLDQDERAVLMDALRDYIEGCERYAKENGPGEGDQVEIVSGVAQGILNRVDVA